MDDSKINNLYQEVKKKNDELVLRYKLLSEYAFPPKQQHQLDAGYDLYSAERAIIPPSANKLIKTDIAIELPRGMYGRIADRSSLALKKMISISGGVIDNGFRGNIGVIIINHGKESYEVIQGSRIAQLIIQPYCTPNIEEVKELNASDRGCEGFGSSGV